MEAVSNLKSQLQQEGFFITDEGLQSCTEDITAEHPSSALTYSALRDYILNVDLKEIAEKKLPENIQRNSKQIPKGPIVLQILALTDVTKPSYRQFNASANERLLLAELSDGHSTCKAIEYKPVPQLSLDTPPGTKLLFKDLKFNDGFLLMDKDVQVLGGAVPALIEAWKAAQLSRRIKRPSVLPQEEGGPPRFKPLPSQDKSKAASPSAAPSKAKERPSKPQQHSKKQETQQQHSATAPQHTKDSSKDNTKDSSTPSQQSAPQQQQKTALDSQKDKNNNKKKKSSETQVYRQVNNNPATQQTDTPPQQQQQLEAASATAITSSTQYKPKQQHKTHNNNSKAQSTAYQPKSTTYQAKSTTHSTNNTNTTTATAATYQPKANYQAKSQTPPSATYQAKSTQSTSYQPKSKAAAKSKAQQQQQQWTAKGANAKSSAMSAKSGMSAAAAEFNPAGEVYKVFPRIDMFPCSFSCSATVLKVEILLSTRNEYFLQFTLQDAVHNVISCVSAKEVYEYLMEVPAQKEAAVSEDILLQKIAIVSKLYEGVQGVFQIAIDAPSAPPVLLQLFTD